MNISRGVSQPPVRFGHKISGESVVQMAREYRERTERETADERIKEARKTFKEQTSFKIGDISANPTQFLEAIEALRNARPEKEIQLSQLVEDGFQAKDVRLAAAAKYAKITLDGRCELTPEGREFIGLPEEPRESFFRRVFGG